MESQKSNITANSLDELVARLQAKGQPVVPSKRRWKRRPTGRKAEFTPEQYAKKLERDRTTWAGVSGAWKHLRKTYNSRGNAKWLISLEEWWMLWREAGLVDGKTVFSRRGKRKGDAKVWRIVPTGDWSLDNMVVVYQGEVRANGRKISQEKAERKE